MVVTAVEEKNKKLSLVKTMAHIPTDPTPADIAAAGFEIQSGWSDEEHLRAHWRPMVRCADGRLVADCARFY